MNFLDHTLPDAAQHYLDTLAQLSVKQAEQNDLMEKTKAQNLFQASQIAALTTHSAEQAHLVKKCQMQIDVLENKLVKLEKNAAWLDRKVEPVVENQNKFLDRSDTRGSKVWQLKYGYLDNGNGTITDPKTGLMWKCERECGQYTWQDAMNRFNRISFAEFCHWRLPTVEQLKTLILRDIHPNISEEAFPDSETWFWSSTEFGSTDAWGVFFQNGKSTHYLRTQRLAVRLVRTSQS